MTHPARPAIGLGVPAARLADSRGVLLNRGRPLCRLLCLSLLALAAPHSARPAVGLGVLGLPVVEVVLAAQVSLPCTVVLVASAVVLDSITVGGAHRSFLCQQVVGVVSPDRGLGDRVKRVEYLGWVDFDLGCSTILLGQ